MIKQLPEILHTCRDSTLIAALIDCQRGELKAYLCMDSALIVFHHLFQLFV